MLITQVVLFFAMILMDQPWVIYSAIIIIGLTIIPIIEVAILK
jgi:hypothetical protein